jgi:tetratricopeptide (TPR) repeat protein
MASGKQEELDETDKAYAGICDAYLQLGDARTALPYCQRGAEILYKSPVAFYNLAGALALSGRKDEAFAALERDVELGDDDYQYLGKDPWFLTLRHDPRFKGLMKRMQAGDQSLESK